jgi:hypothetical protein
MISISKLTSAFRGGHHGEKTTSHDGEKKRQEAGRKIGRSEAEHDTSTGEDNEGRSWAQFVEDETASSDRQSQPSTQNADESVETDGGHGMTDGTSNLPKTGGQVARVVGQLTNDTRVTNLLMLVLVLIGMGGAEALQSQVCSL